MSQHGVHSLIIHVCILHSSPITLFFSKIACGPVADICSNSGIPHLSGFAVLMFGKAIGLRPDGLGCDMRLFLCCVGKIYTRGSVALERFCWFLENFARATQTLSHWLHSNLMNLPFF